MDSKGAQGPLPEERSLKPQLGSEPLTPLLSPFHYTPAAQEEGEGEGWLTQPASAWSSGAERPQHCAANDYY